MIGLEDLSDDILFLVLDYLQIERLPTLQRFRLVSSRLKDFAESQFYKDVTVSDDDDHIDSSNRLIERLINPTDSLSRHVRNFTVASYRGDDDDYCLNSGLILALMHGFQSLYSYSWNSNAPMPQSVLDAFHACCPNSRLCINTRALDPNLLSSAQLYRLELSVACKDRFADETPSLFRRVKNLLLQSRSLRVLSLDIHKDPYIRRLFLGEDDKGKLNLPLGPGDKLPPLEDLTIKARDYCFDLDHCRQWLECMDWERVRRLSFGSCCPRVFFESFTGKIPGLESLCFGDSGQDLDSIASFVIATHVLKELIIRCQRVNFRKPFWENISQEHGGSLKRLVIHEWPEGLGFEVIFEDIEMLGSHFPHLRHLDIALPHEGRGILHWVQGAYPTFLHVLTKFTHLRTLVISCQTLIPTGHSLGSCLLADAYANIRKLWTVLHRHKCADEISRVSLRFWRWAPLMPQAQDHSRSKAVHEKEVIFDGIEIDGELRVMVRGKPWMSLPKQDSDEDWETLLVS